MREFVSCQHGYQGYMRKEGKFTDLWQNKENARLFELFATVLWTKSTIISFAG